MADPVISSAGNINPAGGLGGAVRCVLRTTRKVYDLFRKTSV